MTLPFEVPLLLASGVLVALFASMLGAMFILSRALPVLVSDSHAKSQWLDGLRGLAAALVALNHAPMVLINALIIPKVFYFPVSMTPLFSLLGALGVQLFFCITGSLFAKKVMFAKSLDWADFFAKRVRRIVPAYFLVAFLALLIVWWMTRKLPLEWSSLPAVFSFGLIPLPTINGFELSRVLGVNWSLAIEWRFYMFLPIIFVFSRRYPIVVLCALTAFAVSDLALTQASSWSFFVIGAWGSLLMKREFSVWLRRGALVVAVAAVATLTLNWMGAPNYGLQRWATVAVLFAALAIARPKALMLKPFAALGTVSYSFYLLHAMTLFAAVTAFSRYGGDAGLLGIGGFMLLAGGALVLAAALATASYLLIERRFMRAAVKLSALSASIPAGPQGAM